MRRREFITLFGGAAAWPLAARAQQSERVRRIGVLMHAPSEEPEAQARAAAFLQELQETGWAVGRNVRIDTRWSAGETSFDSNHVELRRKLTNCKAHITWRSVCLRFVSE